ncbi:unnamed protein product [Didymodactylos carnosus]|uniref:Uncharacterized protein n=1 Tax=Didymodactylos carnosus TaxID=1234261 RepID=A0A815W392_9BILA|nr:unnamed protein product [Didymodactylos carnosus]CAF4398074.1 unnamed protein product [Didymodactylos carnosus]
MVVLFCLDSKFKNKTTVKRQASDELTLDSSPLEEYKSTTSSSSRQRQTTVLDSVSNEQTKWLEQVQQQRKSVYKKHELLN